MLAFRINRRQRPAARPTSAERKLDLLGVDRRPAVRKFPFSDIFRNADAEAEMMNPRPASLGFRRFFTQMIPARQLATLTAARMDASFPSASGARLTLLL
jgi:hypothetical protein